MPRCSLLMTFIGEMSVTHVSPVLVKVTYSPLTEAEENTWDSSACVESLLVAFFFGVSALQTSLVAGYGILMRLDTAAFAVSVSWICQ